MFCNIDSQTHTHFLKKLVVYQLSRDQASMEVVSTVDTQYKVMLVCLTNIIAYDNLLFLRSNLMSMSVFTFSLIFFHWIKMNCDKIWSRNHRVPSSSWWLWAAGPVLCKHKLWRCVSWSTLAFLFYMWGSTVVQNLALYLELQFQNKGICLQLNVTSWLTVNNLQSSPITH